MPSSCAPMDGARAAAKESERLSIAADTDTAVPLCCSAAGTWTRSTTRRWTIGYRRAGIRREEEAAINARRRCALTSSSVVVFSEVRRGAGSGRPVAARRSAARYSQIRECPFL